MKTQTMPLMQFVGNACLHMRQPCVKMLLRTDVFFASLCLRVYVTLSLSLSLSLSLPSPHSLVIGPFASLSMHLLIKRSAFAVTCTNGKCHWFFVVLLVSNRSREVSVPLLLVFRVDPPLHLHCTCLCCWYCE